MLLSITGSGLCSTLAADTWRAQVVVQARQAGCKPSVVDCTGRGSDRRRGLQPDGESADDRVELVNGAARSVELTLRTPVAMAALAVVSGAVMTVPRVGQRLRPTPG